MRNRKVVEAIRIMRQIWSQDPPYNIEGEFWNVRLKEAIIPELGIGYMPKPFQKGGPPISLSLASPHSSSARTAAMNDWGILSANITPTYSVASHWAIYSKACAEAGKRASGRKLARRAQPHGGADRCRSSRPGFRRARPPTVICSSMCARCLDSVGQLSIMKPRPDMSEEEATVEAIIDGCTLYGSPKTMLDKLVAFRDEVGPFGTLLMTGFDWAGRTKRGSAIRCSLLSKTFMPKFRQHAIAKVAV